MISLPETIAPVSAWLIVAGYLLGSLSGRRLLGRLGAAGGVAADGLQLLRAERRRFVLGATAIDVAKGALAAWLALRYAPVGDPLSVTAHGYLAAFAAMLGHVWPAWHRFRGGSGASVVAGGLLVLWPMAAVAGLIVGLCGLLMSGYLGLAIVLAGLGLPLLAWWSGAEPPRLGFALAAASMLVITHSAHLMRLRSGTEPRFAFARMLHRWRRS